VASTRAWELKKVSHPVVEPLLEYKKLSRLLSANGWHWMDTWILNGRFHPEYVPGGVVTGRWATRGGGALQLPKQVRGAVVADDGWKLVVADASQLEPRILAALAADTAMATAGRGKDLYEGIVANGVIETRAHAKVAMLGAMYGATSGESGRLLPKLARAYPRALGLTETAARAGERGDIVTTRLGRSSPRPGEQWREMQSQAYDPSASPADERRARSQARDWGRFTRNFIVQGSAAEWALCWMAEIRKALWDLEGSPHLVFFLHDEVIVHTPTELAADVSQIITDAAATAGRLLFGTFPVDFLLTVAVVDSYAEAK
jgi:DNA polymerase-1